MLSKMLIYGVLRPLLILIGCCLLLVNSNEVLLPPRQCEPIRIEMCRGIGYNETAMPNLVGHELQTDVEFTLQTFVPLIEYACSTQLKLFLCAAYVPMCTPKVPVPIGPCRSLCEIVRARCHPVLQGFGFPWPPALDCARFPRENNHKTMCMEGPGEAQNSIAKEHDILNTATGVVKTPNYALPMLECPGVGKAHLYVKLYRSGRCAPLCEADILFSQDEKHLAEVWVATWSYAALGLALVSTMCLIFGDDTKHSLKWSRMLTPLIWCHNMVALGWTVRFVSGRTATACGIDPQLPNVPLLLVDGLSNAACAATFLLRYYFGMAAGAWWAILCLGWHREIRRNSPELHGQLSAGPAFITAASEAQAPLNERIKPRTRVTDTLKRDYDVTRSNLARFSAWGLPAFQTAAVIVARLVDADELLGACFVGNQSDLGLQILVATPLFCYWIFGSMNLISGYLVYRRNKEILMQQQQQSANNACQLPINSNPGIGVFLFIYCVPLALLLLAVIYEFANIDIWLNVSAYYTALQGSTTPLWPFLLRAFMELMLGIICCSWVMGPKISTVYKRQRAPLKPIPAINVAHVSQARPARSYSSVLYQSVRNATPPYSSACTASGTLSMSQRTSSRHKYASSSSAHTAQIKQHKPIAQYVHHLPQTHFIHRYGNETIL